MNKRLKLNLNYSYLISILLVVFCILKVIRGTDTGSTSMGGIWNYISVIFYIFPFIYFFKNKVAKIKPIFLFSIIYVIAVVFSIIISGTVEKITFNFLFYTLMIPIPFIFMFSFCYFFKDGDFEKKILIIGYYICVAINFISICNYLFFGSRRSLASDAYFSLCFFPFCLLFIKNKALLIGTSVLQFLTCFFSNKRAGLLAFIVAIIVYYFVSGYVDNKRNIKKSFQFVLLLSVLVISVYFFSRYIDTRYSLNIYNRLERLNTDGGSGRSNIYLTLLRSYNNSDFFYKLFGHGTSSIKDIVNVNRAHNDLLQILYSYGVIPLIPFVLIIISMIYECIKLFKSKSPYATAFLFAVIVTLFLSNFSYFLTYYTYVIPLSAFIGCLIGMEIKRKENLIG